MTYEHRLEALREEARKAGLGAVAVMPGPNMRYLTGLEFHLSERPVLAIVPLDGDPLMLAPVLEAQKAERAPGQWRAYTYGDVEGPVAAAEALLRSLAIAESLLGIESRRIRHLELELLRAASEAPVVTAADGVFATLRMRKDETEVASMRRAVEVAESAMQAVLPSIAPGTTEKQIATEITLQLFAAGSEPDLPFTPIVASGANGANPHAFPTDKMIGAGELLTLDWGATVDGYHSDITRTFAVAGSEADFGLVQAYDVVRNANRAGRDTARPGATGQDVDRATRTVIEEAGLGAYFVHRTGHGLGLEGHEEPDMNEGSLVPLEPGMTFTIEPGVYIAGLGGVRIEDDMVVTDDGAESLTNMPRELIVVG
jgi:Xaa-Pro dipeptidase